MEITSMGAPFSSNPFTILDNFLARPISRPFSSQARFSFSLSILIIETRYIIEAFFFIYVDIVKNIKIHCHILFILINLLKMSIVCIISLL